MKLRTRVACLVVGALVLGTVLISGCSTTGPEESELPWNTPQSWEGSPMIPGFNEGM